jgi:plant G-box-binding factor
MPSWYSNFVKGAMTQTQEPTTVTTTLGMSIEAPKAQQHDDEGKLYKKANNNSNGKYIGGSRKPEANPR